MVRELVLQKIKTLANKGPHHLPRAVCVEVFHWTNLDYSGPVEKWPTDAEIAEVLNWLIIKKKIRLSGFIESDGHNHVLVEIP